MRNNLLIVSLLAIPNCNFGQITPIQQQFLPIKGRTSINAYFQRPFNTDVYEIKTFVNAFYSNWSIEGMQSAVLRDEFIQTTLQINAYHSLTSFIYLGIGGMHHRFKAIEGKWGKWNTSLHVQIMKSNWHAVIHVKNLLQTKSKSTYSESTILESALIKNVSGAYSIYGSIKYNIGYTPTFLFGSSFEFSKHWTVDFFLIGGGSFQLGSSFKYSFNPMTSVKLGSNYQILLGPSPFLEINRELFHFDKP